MRLAACQVPLYTADIVERYVNRGTPRDGTEPPEPHVFLTADTAYKAMCRSGANQSLVITGESGSGKTETTKIAMQVCIACSFPEEICREKQLSRALGALALLHLICSPGNRPDHVREDFC